MRMVTSVCDAYTTNTSADHVDKAGVPASSTPNLNQPGPRGVKRSRSPDAQSEPHGDHVDKGVFPSPSTHESQILVGSFEGVRYTDDDAIDHPGNKRKRGRPPKSSISESPASATQSLPPLPQSAQTPQLSNQTLPQSSPPRASPTKTTPSKGAVLKALPTVRDHTTDQLNEQGDEYIPREFDEAGEKKVASNGAPLEGREYKCRTFYVPKRGDKLFMLATECARVLGYRDSYLLFNKNRSLFKIIANQEEKDDLISQEILPYSYRSRQIAIVTARSMFRQFGSRLIQNGRRVRDDYWEAKARKQGFTEEDAAGEKRPGAAKQREAQAAAEANNAALLAAVPHGEIIYSNGPGDSLSAVSLPMINLAPTDDMRPRDYSNVQRPRHEISGPAYQDRSQPAPMTEILSQATNTTDFNKALTQQRSQRGAWLQDRWRQPHESQSPILPAAQEDQTGAPSSQAFQSPQMATTGGLPSGQPGMLPRGQQPQPQMINPQAFSQQQHQPNIIAQTPNRPMHQMPGQMPQRSPSVTSSHPQQGGYEYAQNQMWAQGQPQPAPIQQSHPGYQYPGQMAQPSAHIQSPMHAPPQLHHQGSSGQIPMGYQQMGGMNPPGYPNLPRGMYAPSPSPQHFMQSAASSQAGMPAWPPGPQQPGQWQYQ
jgi:Chromatin remodelling complex Rsc7/Swp82 subunit